MFFPIPIQSFQLNLFPAQIFRDTKFTYQFCSSIQVLKNQWQHLNQIIESQPEQYIKKLSYDSFSEKLNLIKKIAHKTSFLSKTITYTKECKGHDIRINSRKIPKRKVDRYINLMTRKFVPDAYTLLKSIHIYQVPLPRRPRRFDIRASFKHSNNSLECDAQVIKEIAIEKIMIYEILNQFEKEVANHNLCLKDQYETLFSYIF